MKCLRLLILTTLCCGLAAQHNNNSTRGKRDLSQSDSDGKDSTTENPDIVTVEIAHLFTNQSHFADFYNESADEFPSFATQSKIVFNSVVNVLTNKIKLVAQTVLKVVQGYGLSDTQPTDSDEYQNMYNAADTFNESLANSTDESSNMNATWDNAQTTESSETTTPMTTEASTDEQTGSNYGDFDRQRMLETTLSDTTEQTTTAYKKEE